MLWFLTFLKLISRKNWEAEKVLNFHTVFWIDVTSHITLRFTYSANIWSARDNRNESSTRAWITILPYWDFYYAFPELKFITLLIENFVKLNYVEKIREIDLKLQFHFSCFPQNFRQINGFSFSSSVIAFT